MRRYRPKFGKLEIRERILVYTEGQTERTYLKKHLSRRQTGVQIKVNHLRKGRLALIKKIIERCKKEDSKDKTSVWVVLDRDENPSNRDDKNQFEKVLATAKRNQISVACSNSCFEVWPLLHFQDIHKAMSNGELLTALSQYFEEYKKDGELVYKTLQEKGDYNAACRRADKLLEKHKGESTKVADANPSTTIHKLIKILRSP